MDRFFVISNVNRDPGMEKAQLVVNYLNDNGKVCNSCSLKRFSGVDEIESKVLDEIADDTQCAIVLGGDGTIIQVAGELAQKGIPLIGINLGKLGFLAEIDQDEIFPTLDKLMRDDCSVEDRMMLEGTPVINGTRGKSSLALNDIVITRSGPMRAIDYDIYVNDKHLTTITGDGIVVSTPTGSTGYSMSAGGPIVEPEAMVILITPISAHKLNSRPIVLEPDDIVTVRVKSESYDERKMVQASFDGGITYDMDKDDCVIIKRAQEITRVVRISAETFIDVLSRKLSS